MEKHTTTTFRNKRTGFSTDTTKNRFNIQRKSQLKPATRSDTALDRRTIEQGRARLNPTPRQLYSSDHPQYENGQSDRKSGIQGI